MTAATPDLELPARAHHLPAALVVAAATALLVVLPDRLGDQGRLAAVLALQLALVAAWGPATRMRGPAGSLVIGLAAAAAADLLLVLPERPELGALLAVPGVAFVAAVLHQMLRKAPRADVVGSLAGVVLLVCAVCAGAVWLRVPDVAGGDGAAATAALVVGGALVVGHLVDTVLPRPQVAPGVPVGVLALLLAVLAGAAVALVRHSPGGLLDTLSSVTVGLVLSAVAVLIGLAASYVVAEGRGRGWSLPVVQAALPIAATAPVAFSVALQTGF
ncbi:hypothetical protein [Blastococcus sp. SYSU D00820]